MEVSINSEKELKDFAANLAKKLEPQQDTATVLAISGDLGTGKTTFVQGLLKAMGVNSPVLSPTFLIIKEYELKGQKFKRAYHIDTYRLKTSKDIFQLGLKDILKEKDSLVLIEWPEIIAEFLPQSSTWIELVHGKTETQRQLSLKK